MDTAFRFSQKAKERSGSCVENVKVSRVPWGCVYMLPRTENFKS